MVIEGFTVFGGEWRCPYCSSSRRDVLSRSDRDVPLCPKCGARMEQAGTGDDDPQHGGLYRVSAVYTPGETMPAPGARLELGPTLHFEYHPEAAVPA